MSIPVTEALCVAFLDELRKNPIVTIAARKLGRAPSTFKYRMKVDEKFAEEVRAAQEEGQDVLLEEARRRGVNGVQRPVYYKGEVVGEVTEYSDRCLELSLIAAFPEKFGKGQGQARTNREEEKLPDTELARRIAHSFHLLRKEEQAKLPIKDEQQAGLSLTTPVEVDHK